VRARTHTHVHTRRHIHTSNCWDRHTSIQRFNSCSLIILSEGRYTSSLTYTHTHIHAKTHARTHTHTHTHTHTQQKQNYLCTHTYTHTRIHTYVHKMHHATIAIEGLAHLIDGVHGEDRCVVLGDRSVHLVNTVCGGEVQEA